jgi:hypothetical protein
LYEARPARVGRLCRDPRSHLLQLIVRLTTSPVLRSRCFHDFGATLSRVNFFMNKLRTLGFIEYNGGLKINNSLLSVVLHD